MDEPGSENSVKKPSYYLKTPYLRESRKIDRQKI